MNFYNLSTPTYPFKFMWGKGDRGSLHSNEDVSPPLDIVMAVFFILPREGTGSGTLQPKILSSNLLAISAGCIQPQFRIPETTEKIKSGGRLAPKSGGLAFRKSSAEFSRRRYLPTGG